MLLKLKLLPGAAPGFDEKIDNFMRNLMPVLVTLHCRFRVWWSLNIKTK
ncbi:hypothetical protein TcasGA2_TC034209 [Tribolium castaneum]|uniref:Uncharacterized protein n=1 Tax=Tribolium castaneum TaxID=7070 RepID=A0A139W8Q3_TRICA|nr:hypothetical protein TcasGA2_TC034209 [Tribolium castaneum]